MSKPTNNNTGVNLGKPSLRRRLEAYYSLIAPDTLSNPQEWKDKYDLIYKKYGGSRQGEAKLAAKLAKKYGNTVRLLVVAPLKRQEPISSKSTRQFEESHYELKPPQQGSGVVNMVSSNFDPIATLKASPQDVVQANPSWFQPQGPILNHLAQCRTLLPECDPLHQVTLSTHKSSTMPTTKKHQQPKKQSAFAALAATHNKGPMVLLHNCMLQRQRVRVLIRYVNGIRGTLTGYLIAFDKHMNMILRDVDEVYTPRYIPHGRDDHNGDGTAQPSNVEVEVTRRLRAMNETTPCNKAQDATCCWSVRQRHLKQIMVRGDNVVLAYRAEREKSSWPHTSKSPNGSQYQSSHVSLPPQHKRVGTPGSLVYALHQRERRKSSKKY